ncbi:MAG: aldehyde dehydrogenase family protein [Gammaproteobacteria bacterium]|nr:aldehyde dehydrogenase family protein [Gammaproteobacteria bacterium]
MNQQLTTVSPIDGSTYVERPFATQGEIDSKMDKARSAQQAWKKVSLAERKKLCTQAVDAFVAKKDEIAQEICWQMGRPIRSAAGEVSGMEERARTMIQLADQGLATVKLDEKPGFQRWIQRDPVGVVFVIAPWNYPYLTAINAIMPAILAGNSVVLKHSAQTPLCAERLFDAFKTGGLPEGVFQYLHLTHGDTEAVIKDERTSYIAFTGSVNGGEMVEKAAAGRFISVGLELGGKDPAYVRGDADLTNAVDTTMDGAFFNSGQSCCGIERIYVHESVYENFIQQAVVWVHNLKLGRPDDTETTMGPVVRSSAADFVRDQTKEAIEQGAIANISTDNFSLDKPGTPYLAPQLLTHVNHKMRVMTEESFGPVVGIQKVSSDDEAVRLMNDSEYGLTAAIFTQDIDRGIELGQQLDTGTFFINRCDYLDPELAWTGVKNSGHGCTLSVMGYESLTRPKSFHIKTEL